MVITQMNELRPVVVSFLHSEWSFLVDDFHLIHVLFDLVGKAVVSLSTWIYRTLEKVMTK